jgi:hypothetical protein
VGELYRNRFGWYKVKISITIGGRANGIIISSHNISKKEVISKIT